MVPPGIPIRTTIESGSLVNRPSIGGLELGQSAFVDVRLEYSQSAGKYEVAAFGVDRLLWDFEVTGAFLRTVKVHQIVYRAIYDALPTWGRTVLQLRTSRDVAEARGIPVLKPSDNDALLLAAMVYRLAQLSGETPALAVSEALGLKARTATNWIQRAREAGYLSSVAHARAARDVARKVAPYVEFQVLPGVDEITREIVNRMKEGRDGDG